MDDCCRRTAKIAAHHMLCKLYPHLGPTAAMSLKGSAGICLEEEVMELTELEFQKHPFLKTGPKGDT